LALFGAGCSSGTSKNTTSQQPTASAFSSLTATAFPAPPRVKPILQGTPSCDEPSGTVSVWSSPSRTFSKTCLFDFLGLVLNPGATSELDLDSVNGRPYAGATEWVYVSLDFGADFLLYSPPYPHSSAMAGVALTTVSAAKTSGANTTSYKATIDTTRTWKLSRVVGDTAVTIAKGPMPPVDSTGGDIALELYHNHIYLWIDTVPVALTSVVSDTSLGDIALVAANTSSQRADVEYLDFLLQVSP
jgi:hypothetical protein